MITITADLAAQDHHLRRPDLGTPSTMEEAETLDLPDRTPAIQQLRVIYSDNQRPAEASVLTKGAHLYELLYHQTTETESG